MRLIQRYKKIPRFNMVSIISPTHGISDRPTVSTTTLVFSLGTQPKINIHL